MLPISRQLWADYKEHRLSFYRVLRNKQGQGGDDDDVDEVTLCLWTAATIRPIVLPPDDTWAWRTMVELYPQGKTPHSSTRAREREHCFSTLKSVKTYLRNSIGAEAPKSQVAAGPCFTVFSKRSWSRKTVPLKCDAVTFKHNILLHTKALGGFYRNLLSCWAYHTFITTSLSIIFSSLRPWK
jgi:hypothetical protein